MKKVTQVVILAAGSSSRFYPYNSLGHKSQVVLGGKSFLQRTLENLRKQGIVSIIIVENGEELLSKSLTTEEKNGVKFLVQTEATGMGDALLCATKYLENNFFVLNAYHFEAASFLDEMGSAVKEDSDIVLLTKEASDLSSFGAVSISSGKPVISEKKETGKGEKIVGVYLLNRDFVYVLHDEKKDHYSFENALSAYSEKKTLVLVKTSKETLSLKYPWDLLSVKDYLLRDHGKISKKANISKKSILKGRGITVEEGATIMDGAVVSGPVYIGKNAYIGTNAILRGGVCVEEKAVVGAQMEIKNSILMRGATTHSGFIGDSIIGENTKIAAGFNTANVRLDRKEIHAVVKGEKTNTHMKNFGVIVGSNCNIGIKIGTMPGIIIGNKVIIGPGTTVMENIDDGVTYYTKFEKIVKKKAEPAS